MAIYNIKGFLEIPTFVSNTPDAIAPIGELSAHSRTYELDRQTYSDESKPFSDVVIFHSQIAGADAAIPGAAVQILHDIMQKAQADFVTTQPFEVQLLAAFPDLTEISTGSETLYLGKQYPNWLEFTLESGADSFVIKMWLSDQSFRIEYPHYTIKVVGPTESVQDMASSYLSVLASKDAVSLEQHLANVEAARADTPQTAQQVVELTWIDPTDTSNTVKLNFICIVYGSAGESFNNKIEAIRQYLVNNSSKTLPEWITYFPELLNVDVLTFIPQWGTVAVAAVPGGGVGIDSIYSPTFKYDKGMDEIRKIFTQETLTALKKVTDISSLNYKSLGMAVVGSDSNQEGKQRFSEIYPDYVVLQGSDINNINRISAPTIACIQRLATMIRACEEDDGSQDLPVGYTRTAAGAANYLEVIENNVVFRMVTKASFLALSGITNSQAVN